MHLIVGLGNPGAKYARTRHNVGYMVADALAEKLEIGFSPGTGPYVFASGKTGDRELCLIKPATYMNHSGEAVAHAAAAWQVSLDALLIVYDDFHLPFGTLRARPQGGDGGHNGMASIIEHLGSQRIARLRVGIGVEEIGEDAAGFVLSEFTDAEAKHLKSIINACVLAVETHVREGIAKTMNRFNRNILTA